MTVSTEPPEIAADPWTWRTVLVPTRTETWGELCDEFLAFFSRMTIDTKEEGAIRPTVLSSQLFLVYAIFAGLASGRHDFVILKARQLGISTILWALDLFWMMKFGGLKGFYIADSDENKELHRDELGLMLDSVPVALRRKTRVSNRLQLAFATTPAYRGSRLMFSAANKKNTGQLGRSKGLNYIHAEELDSWEDPTALGSLDAARAAKHPLRLYLWVGTGQGYGELYKMWEQAGESVFSKQIFIGFWHLDTNIITPETDPAAWEVYGTAPFSQDEQEWADEVQRRFGHRMTIYQVAWWRMTKMEGKGIAGDEAKALQEHPWLPEQAFQASGSQFISATTALRLRTALSRAPEALCYRFDWGTTFDENGDETIVEVDAKLAQLTVWQEPRVGSYYIVAGDPAYGSSEHADAFAATVWRVHPDALVQVATYHAQVGTMYQFAWVLAYLSCNYPRWLIYDINGPGVAVLQEFRRLREQGLGLTHRGGGLQDAVGSIQEYLWSRPDVMSPSFNWQWKTGPSTQEPLMEQLRNEVERGALVMRDSRLVTEIAALRRDKGRIEPGGMAHDDLAVTAAMAVEYWLNGDVLPEIEGIVAPLSAPEAAPPAIETTLRGFMSRMNRVQEPAGPRISRGVRPGGPGR